MEDLAPLVEFVRRHRKCDIFAYNDATIKRCIQQRLSATGNRSLQEYLEYLEHRAEELDSLLDVLTINVSHFYRDTLSFEYLEHRILPVMLFEKRKANDRMIRIWSAGCAGGEEPYSIAILIKHLIEEEDFRIMIFGTDIDESALTRAREGSFRREAVKHVKLELLEKYFIREGSRFGIAPEIKKMVVFSRHDLTDARSKVPSESVFGDFDMVFCRNVLIYLRPDAQASVIEKYHCALVTGGYLVLGRAEELLAAGLDNFKKVTDACPIFQKQ